MLVIIDTLDHIILEIIDIQSDMIIMMIFIIHNDGGHLVGSIAPLTIQVNFIIILFISKKLIFNYLVIDT
jgi:hypothetical protein